MSNSNRLNLKDDVENVAERFGLDPNMEARYGRRPLDIEGGGFSYQKLAPNYRPPTAHRHNTQEEVYIVIAGSGRVKIDDEVLAVRRWGTIRCAPGTARGFESGPEGLELLAIGFGDTDEAEMLGGFWGADS